MKSDKFTRAFVKYLLPVVILITGVLIIVFLLKTKPKSKRQPPARQAKLVETISVNPEDVTVKIYGMGTVVPARQVVLRPQVSGKIIEINPELIPGGLFKKGQKLLQIEPDDYELTLQQRQNDLASAKSNLEIEHGNQDIAKQEYEMLGNLISESDKSLVLRKPQLVSAQSNVETAQAKVDQAKLDLERTSIKTPFNAVINEKYVELGQMVSQATDLLALTGIDEYWVETSIPVDKLKWVKVPNDNEDDGSQANIYNSSAWGNDSFRQGKVLRLLPDLEKSGRMAKLLVSIKDPMEISHHQSPKKPLLLGSYVRVEIMGEVIKSAYVLDRSIIHNGNEVWLLDEKGTLKIQPVKVIYKNDNKVIISNGISFKDKIVTTDLSAPVKGMLLRTADPEKNDAEFSRSGSQPKNK